MRVDGQRAVGKRVFIRIKSAAMLFKGALSDILLLPPQLSLAVSGSAPPALLKVFSLVCVCICVCMCVWGGAEGSGLGECHTTQNFETVRIHASGRLLKDTRQHCYLGMD